jgi:hypothetical protein
MRKVTRINLTVSEQVAQYLEQLSEIGVHGTKPTEVASALISREIERLIREGFLKLPSSAGKK